MRQIKAQIGASLLAIAAAASPAQAGEMVMVELFTSQGCYSCPPADDVLGVLADNQNIVALAMHVDYWDYLGWRDTFAQRGFTERQYSYRKTMGARVVYTPQMIVQGVNPVTGSRSMSVKDAIAQAQAQPDIAAIEIVAEGDQLVGQLEPLEGSRRATLFMAHYKKDEVVDIARGENGGKKLHYHNIVKSLAPMMEWSGTSERVALPQPGPGEGIAIWLQEGRTGPVLGAAKFEN